MNENVMELTDLEEEFNSETINSLEEYFQRTERTRFFVFPSWIA